MDLILKLDPPHPLSNQLISGTPLKEAALKAMEKLKKYYSNTDALPYTIATGM